ncbi:MAG: VCBS repeat-containing protein, partial [Mariprofundaceae bacterium]
MNNWRRLRNIALFLMVCTWFLPGCRSIVPTPTPVANSQGSSLGSYVMHQIGPQHVRESYVGHFADLNRDGHLDLLVGGRAPFEGFRIEWGTGDGNWRMQTGPDTSMVPRAFSAMDTDFDGIDEILVCGQGDQKGLQVWTMDDASRFQLHSSPIE